MKTKEIDIGGKKYTIQELNYKQGLILSELSKDNTAFNTKLIELSIVGDKPDLSETTLKEGTDLIKEITELNGLSKDFTNPQDTGQDTQKS